MPQERAYAVPSVREANGQGHTAVSLSLAAPPPGMTWIGGYTMPPRKSTIRKMRGQPLARKFYHLVAELESVATRLEKLGSAVSQAEFDSIALEKGRRPK